MRQAITTKYLGPTNSRGSRIKAIARKRSPMGGEMSHTEPYQHEGTEREHCRAAHVLATKLGWSGLWIGGGNVDEDGFVFVNTGDANWATDKWPEGTEGRDWFYVAAKREG